jgi:hypothetical protein
MQLTQFDGIVRNEILFLHEKWTFLGMKLGKYLSD